MCDLNKMYIIWDNYWQDDMIVHVVDFKSEIRIDIKDH